MLKESLSHNHHIKNFEINYTRIENRKIIIPVLQQQDLYINIIKKTSYMRVFLLLRLRFFLIAGFLLGFLRNILWKSSLLAERLWYCRILSM